MRTLGVAIFGVLAGLVVGFLLFSELLGRLILQVDDVGAPWTYIIGFGPQVTAVAGGVVALGIDNRIRRRKGQGKQ